MHELTVETIKLFGDHPVLDFTNTVDSRGAHFGPDVLRTFPDLLRWGARVGLIDRDQHAGLQEVGTQRADEALSQAKALREALYRIFAAPSLAAGSDLDLLQRHIRAGQTMRRLAGWADGFTWSWSNEDPDTITHRIAFAAADLLTSAALRRVRVCPGENCHWLFLDTSRPGRRRWCSEETCGTRDRVRRWRTRQLRT